MKSSIEDELKSRFHDPALRFDKLPEAFVQQVVVEGRSRRRRRILTISGTAAAIAGLAAVVVFSQSRLDSATERGPAESPDASVLMPDGNGLAWARQLPQGPPPDRPFDISQSLFDAGQQLSLANGTVIGRVPDGWLVIVTTGELSAGLAVMSSDESISMLPSGIDDDINGAAISPDGHTVAYEGIVVDSNTGQVLYRMPDGVTEIIGWTTSGIIYQRNSGEQVLWEPGGASHVLPAYVLADGPSATVLTHAPANHDCWAVTRLSPTGGLDEIHKGCRDQRPLSVSPDGSRALLQDGTVLGLDSGSVDVLGRFDMSPELRESSSWPPIWETDQSILFAVEGEYQHEFPGSGISGAYTAFAIRCNVDQMTCERAGPVLHPTAGDELEFRLDYY